MIPFLTGLSELMPTATTRLRRDFPAGPRSRAHAILHRATRDTDEQGRVVATLADYAAVYALVADLIAEAADAAVTPAVRETVEAVEELVGTNSDAHVTVKQIEQKLGVGHSAAYDRVNDTLLKGYLVNVAVKGKLVRSSAPRSRFTGTSCPPRTCWPTVSGRCRARLPTACVARRCLSGHRPPAFRLFRSRSTKQQRPPATAGSPTNDSASQG